MDEVQEIYRKSQNDLRRPLLHVTCTSQKSLEEPSPQRPKELKNVARRYFVNIYTFTNASKG